MRQQKIGNEWVVTLVSTGEQFKAETLLEAQRKSIEALGGGLND